MKVYISVDIEGITGVTNWDETEIDSSRHSQGGGQMKKETLAAVRGAIKAGATEVWVKDAHDSARNMWADEFPPEVRFVRGWMCSPEVMMAGIDETFDAAIAIGYHSGGGTNGNPLAHTMTDARLYWTKVNGELISELEMNAMIAGRYGVPMVFVSGDQDLCEKAVKVLPGIGTVSSKKCIGQATINRSAELVEQEIEAGVEAALKEMSSRCVAPVEDKPVTLEMCCRHHSQALRASYYPGAVQVDDFTVRYEAKNVWDMITAYFFMMPEVIH
ncbi:MAG: M55 family metallopeptidase [Firmicutes bacterium]|nr:M55 family metallopeptidase [Bacillota bacterium]